MKHLTLPRFWQCYHQLPKEIQALADKNYNYSKSIRSYRALGVEKSEGIVWFWIGTHGDYDAILAQK